jgi:MFS family permease
MENKNEEENLKNSHDLKRENEDTILLHKAQSDSGSHKHERGLIYFQSIVDQVGMVKYQYFIAFACGLIYFNYGSLVYEFNFIYPTLTKLLHLNDFRKELISASLGLGELFGAILAHSISKKFGRRSPILFSSGLLMVFSLLMIAYVNIWWMSFCRLICGFSIGLTATLMLPTLIELLPTDKREFMTLGAISFYRLGIIFYVLVDKLVISPDNKEVNDSIKKEESAFIWKYSILLSSIVTIVSFVIFNFAVRESPRFLFLNLKSEEAIKIMKEIFPLQNMNLDEERLKREAIDFNEDKKDENNLCVMFDEKYLYLTIITTLMMAASSILNMSNIYSLPLILKYNINDLWPLVVLQQALGFVAVFFSAYLAEIPYIGRKYTLFMGYMATLIIATVTLIFSDGIKIVSPLINIPIVISYTVSKMYLTEVFPTNLRIYALASAAVLCRAGDLLVFMMSDYTNKLFHYGPMLVMVVGSLIGSTCSYLISIETSHLQLDFQH